MKAIFTIIFLTTLLMLSGTSFSQTVMIVNSANETTNMTQTAAADYFLGKSTQWSNSTKLVPVEQSKSSDAGKAFLEKIVKMSDGDYKNYWVEKMLSGEAEPSKSCSSDADVINFVSQNKGAIGYISEPSLTSDVKVISIDGSSNW